MSDVTCLVLEPRNSFSRFHRNSCRSGDSYSSPLQATSLLSETYNHVEKAEEQGARKKSIEKSEEAVFFETHKIP
jgi:hypothetical protein